MADVVGVVCVVVLWWFTTHVGVVARVVSARAVVGGVEWVVSVWTSHKGSANTSLGESVMVVEVGFFVRVVGVVVVVVLWFAALVRTTDGVDAGWVVGVVVVGGVRFVTLFEKEGGQG